MLLQLLRRGRTKPVGGARALATDGKRGIGRESRLVWLLTKVSLLRVLCPTLVPPLIKLRRLGSKGSGRGPLERKATAKHGQSSFSASKWGFLPLLPCAGGSFRQRGTRRRRHSEVWHLRFGLTASYSWHKTGLVTKQIVK